MKTKREFDKITAGSLWGCQILTTKDVIMEACKKSCSEELIKWCHSDENRIYESGCCLGKLNLKECMVLNKNEVERVNRF